MTEPLVAVARILQRMRLSRRWSLADLSQKSGVSAVTIIAYETDPQSLSALTALRIFRGMPPRPDGEDFPQGEPPPQEALGRQEARLREIEAAVCVEDGRLYDALDKLDQALALSPALDRVGATQISRAVVLGRLGREEEALDALREAESCLDPDGLPEIWLRVRLDQLYLLCQTERFAEAETRLAEALDLMDLIGRDPERLPIRRLSGWVAAGTGRAEDALGFLLPVCDELLADGRVFEAAGIGLDLAAVLASLGRSADVEEIARQLGPLVEEKKLTPEARTTLQAFCWAVRRGTFKAELGRRLAAELRRAGSHFILSYDIPI